MDILVINTSLEALIQRATCNQNQCPDTAAIDAFCGLVNKEPDCAQTATRYITAKVHSLQEWEALQALHVLDACMKRCGSTFHAEVGKFRFLNELIKLVSPKYNGAHTPEPVKRRVLELMQSWTVYYPREFKIKEAYDMLKKQGVVKEETLRPLTEAHKSLDQNIVPPPPPRHEDSIFQDTEKSRLLQKLLQSKNPDDLQAANRLIKTMVKEDEKRVEMKSRHLSELEAAHNNARLLSEMLDCYNRDASSPQDFELISELQASCLRYRPNIQRLLSEVHSDDRLFNEVLAANDELGEVLEKYSAVIEQGLPAGSVGGNLLDLSSPSVESLPTPPIPAHSTDTLLCDSFELSVASSSDLQVLSSALPPLSLPPQTQPLTDFTSLGDIFSSLSNPLPPSDSPLDSPFKKGVEKRGVKTGLEELDAISESLLKQSLPQSTSQPPVKTPMKVPMNQLSVSHQASPVHSSIPIHSTLPQPAAPSLDAQDLLIGCSDDQPLQVNGDTPMVDLALDHLPENKETPTADVKPAVETPAKSEVVKPIGDLNVPLESIKPGSLPPLTVIEERGVSVTIHFARDSPRPDTSVFVVTTTSNSQFPITDYLFQAIVPKGCRLRLQPPSSTELPSYSPFLPPAAITQVMLIASPAKETILLRVVVSFTMDDETVTDMKEVESFPLLNS